MASQTIHLYSLSFERSLRATAIQHGMAGALLLLAGAEQLSEPHEAQILTWLALLAGAVVMIAAIVELRSLKRHHHANYGWVDLLSVPVLLIEGFHKLHLGKKYLPIVYFVLAAVLLVKGFFFERLLHLRYIKLSETGLAARLSPFRKLQLAWRDIRSLQCTAERIDITMSAGTAHVIDLKNVRNQQEVQTQVLDFYRQLQTTAIAR